ncbi:MAG: hypothetical protein M3Z09_14715, partial [Acidobacteriota bacterium]|nr:hypothetical protein [Acidobacteriota bacterium]
SWTSPETLLRLGLGVLLLANLAAAGFAFHWWGASPRSVESRIDDLHRELNIEISLVSKTKLMAAKVETARDQSGKFINTYMTSRRVTYSTVLGELNQMASTAGIKTRETGISRDQVEGSESLSMLTITAGYQASYANLLKFMNQLDKSPRFIIIESVQAAPQANSQDLLVTVKLNTFVRDDVESQL